MATTGRSGNRPGARSGAPAKPHSHGRSSRQRAVAVAVASALPALLPGAALAQRWSVEAGVGSQLTWSSNAELGAAEGREDTILNVRPHVTIHTDGARLRVHGTAALNAITSANGTQPSRLLPEGDLQARLEAVQRFMFVEAGVRARQTSVDPFGASPEAATNQNALTALEANFTPSIESTIGPFIRYRLRSANSVSRARGADTSAASAGEGYFGRHSAMIERDPRPLGWRLEAERSQTRYRDPSDESLTQDLIRASADYALDTDWTVGVRAGRERGSFLLDDEEHPIYGVQARWQPSPRTTLSMFDEKRFFGSAWNVAFDHRMPRVAWNLSLSRSLDTAPQSLFDLPASDNVAGLLDAMFTTRFPDPVERAKVVQDFITRQGLPSQTLQPTSLFARRLSIVTTRRVSVAFAGIRSSLSLGAFQTRTEDAVDTGPLATGSALTNNTQHGASVGFSHRLAANMSVNASADWSRIRALGSADNSSTRTVRLGFTLQATPKTNAFAGARYRDLDSNVATEGREGAVFVGFDHRF